MHELTNEFIIEKYFPCHNINVCIYSTYITDTYRPNIKKQQRFIRNVKKKPIRNFSNCFFKAEKRLYTFIMFLLNYKYNFISSISVLFILFYIINMHHVLWRFGFLTLAVNNYVRNAFATSVDCDFFEYWWLRPYHQRGKKKQKNRPKPFKII